MKKHFYFILIFIHFSYYPCSHSIFAGRNALKNKWNFSQNTSVNEYLHNRLIINQLYKKSEESIDGNDLQISLIELEAELEKSLPQLIFKKFDLKEVRKKIHLKINEPDDINKIFFILSKLYPNNIECDTASILVSYYQTWHVFDLDVLHKFLIGRFRIMRHDSLTEEHEYLINLDNIHKKLGKSVVNIHDFALDQILIMDGDQALIRTPLHIGIIKRIAENKYLATAWNEIDGVFFINLNFKYGEILGVDEWNDMKITRCSTFNR